MMMYVSISRELVSHLMKASSGVKLARHEIKARPDGKKLTVHSPEKARDVARRLTLDDFGGRSDALGG
jgi:hypothetical protein